MCDNPHIILLRCMGCCLQQKWSSQVTMLDKLSVNDWYRSMSQNLSVYVAYECIWMGDEYPWQSTGPFSWHHYQHVWLKNGTVVHDRSVIWIWYASIMLGVCLSCRMKHGRERSSSSESSFEHPTNSVSVIGEEKPYTQEAGSINLYRNISKWTQFLILK